MNFISTHFSNRVSKLCLDHYTSLHKTGKPISGKEWTVLSSIVQYDDSSDNLEVISLGTGSKCIGRSQMSIEGDVLNDCHSEVMARRGFLRYIYHQLHLSSCEDSIFIYNNVNAQFKLKSNISFHFFSSHTPCGDASIFFTDSSNDDLEGDILESDDFEKESVSKICKIQDCDMYVKDIFRTGAKCLENSTKLDSRLPGIEYHVLGVVRTKPGRGDPTLSVSCSDKLARWNIVGIQGALLCLFIEKPIYIESFTFCTGSSFCYDAFHRSLFRCFITSDLLHEADGFKIQHPFVLKVDDRNSFEHSRRHKVDLQPCPSSIVWCKVKDRCLEIAVLGKKQGVTKQHLNTSKGRLLISKKELFCEFFKTVEKYPGVKNRIFSGVDNVCSFNYLNVKQRAKNYQKTWNYAKTELFKNWVFKPEQFNLFII